MHEQRSISESYVFSKNDTNNAAIMTELHDRSSFPKDSIRQLTRTAASMNAHAELLLKRPTYYLSPYSRPTPDRTTL